MAMVVLSRPSGNFSKARGSFSKATGNYSKARGSRIQGFVFRELRLLKGLLAIPNKKIFGRRFPFLPTFAQALFWSGDGSQGSTGSGSPKEIVRKNLSGARSRSAAFAGKR